MRLTRRWLWLKKGTPVIINANCVRIHSHSNSDRHDLYRDNNELSYVKEYDPLAKFRRVLLRYNRFTEETLVEIEAKAKAVVKAAHKKVISSPDPTPESIYEFLEADRYESEKYPDGLPTGEGKELKLIEALNETLKAEFRHNPDTYLWGQDVANKEKGGIFNVSKGMQQEFGPTRVFNGPIAEDFILGTANGMSRYDRKLRIVVEGAEFADYFWPAMEQYVELTHEYWRTKGQFVPNIIIRLASGGYIGGGLYHSQNIEGALASIPGVRIVYPSFADDAAGLMRTAMRSEGPTLFLEPKALYQSTRTIATVPDDFEVPFGKARVRVKGSDLTVITYGNTSPMCEDAALEIESDGDASIEVIDLRSLVPLDMGHHFDIGKENIARAYRA